MRDVTILPYGANISSMSACVMLRGNPLTYKLAPFILSLLGRARDTYIHATHAHLLVIGRFPLLLHLELSAIMQVTSAGRLKLQNWNVTDQNRIGGK